MTSVKRERVRTLTNGFNVNIWSRCEYWLDGIEYTHNHTDYEKPLFILNPQGALSLPSGSIESIHSLFTEAPLGGEQQQQNEDVNRRASTPKDTSSYPTPTTTTSAATTFATAATTMVETTPKEEPKLTKQQQKELRKSQRKNKGKKLEISAPIQQTGDWADCEFVTSFDLFSSSSFSSNFFSWVCFQSVCVLASLFVCLFVCLLVC